MDATRVIVDGNNLLHVWRDRPAHARDFASVRFALARMLGQMAGEIGSLIIIVFDGSVGGRDESLSSAGVDVIYASAGMTADTLIERRVRDDAHPEDFLIVTNDRGIQRMTSGCGAELMGCEAFLEWIGDRSRAMGSRLRRPGTPRRGSTLGDFFPDP